MARIVIGTRATPLARIQADLIARRLGELGVETTVRALSSQGDRSLGGSFAQAKGVFTGELTAALRDGSVDLVVHSLKDLPVEDEEDLVIAAVPKRERPFDLLLFGPRLATERRPATLEELLDGGENPAGRSADSAFAVLPPGARLGTSSPRRQAAALAIRPDLICCAVRGSVGRRLEWLQSGAIDALLAAEAGLLRLLRAGELEAPDTIRACRLDLRSWPCAPGQGALAVQILRGGRLQGHPALAALDDAPSRAAAFAERSLLERLGGGCLRPLGAWANAAADERRRPELREVHALVATDDWREPAAAGRAPAVVRADASRPPVGPAATDEGNRGKPSRHPDAGGIDLDALAARLERHLGEAGAAPAAGPAHERTAPPQGPAADRKAYAPRRGEAQEPQPTEAGVNGASADRTPGTPATRSDRQKAAAPKPGEDREPQPAATDVPGTPADRKPGAPTARSDGQKAATGQRQQDSPPTPRNAGQQSGTATPTASRRPPLGPSRGASDERSEYGGAFATTGMEPGPWRGSETPDLIVTSGAATARRLTGRLDPAVRVAALPTTAVEVFDVPWPADGIDLDRVRRHWPWLLVSSPTAARVVVERAANEPVWGRLPWCALGEGTARALLGAGVPPNLAARAAGGTEFARYAHRILDPHCPLFVPHSARGGAPLVAALQAAGRQVVAWAAYTVHPRDELRWPEAWQAARARVLFTAPSAVSAFAASGLAWPRSCWAIGAATDAALRGAGAANVKRAKQPTAGGIERLWLEEAGRSPFELREARETREGKDAADGFPPAGRSRAANRQRAEGE